MNIEKRFPIQGGRVGDGRREPGWVPWGVAEEAYKVYSRHYGTGQTLERLAERGGFSWSELVNLLRDGDPYYTIPLGKTP